MKHHMIKMIRWSTVFVCAAVVALAAAEETKRDQEISYHPKIGIVTADNYTDVVERRQKDLFIEVYAPWCGFCRAFEPVAHRLADAMAEIDSVDFVRINGDDKHIGQIVDEKLKVDGFPTLIFMPKGANSKDYRDFNKLSVRGILADILKSASTKFELPASVKAMNDETDPDPFGDEGASSAEPAGEPAGTAEEGNAQEKHEEGDNGVTIVNSAAMTIVTHENYTKIVENRDTDVLLEVYAPWCGACKTAEPVMHRIADALVDIPSIIFARMDGDFRGNEEILGRKLKIEGFPTLMFFPKDKSKERFSSFTQLSARYVINLIQGFATTRFEIPASVKAMDDKTDPDPFGAMMDESGGGEAHAEQEGEDGATAPQREIAHSEYMTIVTGENFTDIVENRKTDVMLEIYAPWCGACKTIESSMHRVAELMHPIKTFTLARLNGDDKSNAGVMAKLKVQEFPTIIVFPQNKTVEPVRDFLQFSARDLILRINLVATNKFDPPPGLSELTDETDPEPFGGARMEPLLKKLQNGEGDEPEAEQQGEGGPSSTPFSSAPGMTIVSGQNYSQVVEDRDKDVLVEVYAPWCGFCQTVEPVMHRLAGAVEKIPSLTFARLNGDDRSAEKILQHKLKIEGFPTLIFMPKDKSAKHFSDFNRMSVRGILADIQQRASIKFDLPAEVKQMTDETDPDPLREEGEGADAPIVSSGDESERGSGGAPGPQGHAALAPVALLAEPRDLESIVDENEILALVYADWCKACGEYAPLYARFAEGAKNITGLKVVRVNVENESFESLLRAWGVENLPSVAVIRRGRTKEGGFNATLLKDDTIWTPSAILGVVRKENGGSVELTADHYSGFEEAPPDDLMMTMGESSEEEPEDLLAAFPEVTTEEQLRELVKKGDVAAVYYALWCEDSRTFAPVFTAAKKRLAGATNMQFVRINHENHQLKTVLNSTAFVSTPTIAVFKHSESGEFSLSIASEEERYPGAKLVQFLAKAAKNAFDPPAWPDNEDRAPAWDSLESSAYGDGADVAEGEDSSGPSDNIESSIALLEMLRSKGHISKEVFNAEVAELKKRDTSARADEQDSEEKATASTVDKHDEL